MYLKNALTPGGGGKQDAHNTVWIYFVKLESPKFQGENDGSEFLKLNPVMNNSVSHPSVQNIVLRIESDEIIAWEILSLLNISKL